MNENDLFRYAEKWFVLMHESLFREDPHLIGFRDVTEWQSIFEESSVVYYQFGAQYLRGIYEVAETGRLLKPNYGIQFERNELQYQCRLKHYGGPRNSDSVLSYTWEQKRGGPSGEFEEEAHTVI